MPNEPENSLDKNRKDSPATSASHLYEYAVIRYVPDVERGEFLNVGLLMMCKRRRWLRMEVRIPMRRLAAYDAPHSAEDIERQLDGWHKVAAGDPAAGDMASWPVEERYRWLTAAKSASLQTSPSHPGLSPDLEATFSMLASRLV